MARIRPECPLALVLLTALLAAPGVRAQANDAADLTMRLAAMTAVTGYEQAMVDTVLSLLPGATRDRAGNAVLVRGNGSPSRLAACPLDETGFVVGRVRPDGWLTLRRSPARIQVPGPLFDQQLEGQRVTVFTKHRALPGVVAVRSVHLTRGRGSLPDDPFTVDDALVDIGVSSASQATALGVAVLDPVTLAKHPRQYGTDRIAAPWAGRRAACAALLAAAKRGIGGQGRKPASGTTVIAFVVQHQLDAAGLLTVATTRGPFRETWIVDAAGGASALERAELAAGSRTALGQLHAWDVATTYAGTPAETVALGDVGRTAAAIEAWLAGEAPR